MLPVGRAGHRGGALPQQVLEQLAPQVLLGHIGPGDGEGDDNRIAALGVCIGGFQLLDVEVQPHLVVGDLHGLQVQRGVLGLSVHLPVDGLKVRVRRGVVLCDGHGNGLLNGAALPAQALHKGLFNGGLGVLLHLRPVDAGPGRGLGHYQLEALNLVAVLPCGVLNGLFHVHYKVVQG